MGAPFSPPGVALGALGGFVIWGAGEVIGGLVDRAFGDKERCRNEHGDKEDRQTEEEQHDEPADAEEQQHSA